MTRAEVYALDGNRCLYCGNEPTDANPLTLDHVVPLALGGSNRLCNLLTACRLCNIRKGRRTTPLAPIPPERLADNGVEVEMTRRGTKGNKQAQNAAYRLKHKQRLNEYALRYYHAKKAERALEAGEETDW